MYNLGVAFSETGQVRGDPAAQTRGGMPPFSAQRSTRQPPSLEQSGSARSLQTLNPDPSSQTERAVYMYETVLHFNPTCVEAHNNLGVLYKERDNLEKAVECYMAALTIRPNFPQVGG